MFVNFSLGPAVGLASRLLTITQMPVSGSGQPTPVYSQLLDGTVTQVMVPGIPANRVYQAQLTDTMAVVGGAAPVSKTDILGFNTGGEQIPGPKSGDRLAIVSISSAQLVNTGAIGNSLPPETKTDTGSGCTFTTSTDEFIAVVSGKTTTTVVLPATPGIAKATLVIDNIANASANIVTLPDGVKLQAQPGQVGAVQLYYSSVSVKWLTIDVGVFDTEVQTTAGDSSNNVAFTTKAKFYIANVNTGDLGVNLTGMPSLPAGTLPFYATLIASGTKHSISNLTDGISVSPYLVQGTGDPVIVCTLFYNGTNWSYPGFANIGGISTGGILDSNTVPNSDPAYYGQVYQAPTGGAFLISAG